MQIRKYLIKSSICVCCVSTMTMLNYDDGSKGEYVAAEKIANVLQQSPLVAQAFVYGDSYQSHLVAILAVDEEAVATRFNIGTALITPPRVCVCFMRCPGVCVRACVCEQACGRFLSP